MKSSGRRQDRQAARRPLHDVLAACLVLGIYLIAQSAAAEERHPGSLAGRILIAAADMVDPNFSGSLVYMVEHDETGAFGLVINRFLGSVKAVRLLEDLGADGGDAEGEIPVHQGGPVEPGAGFVLHSRDFKLADSILLEGDIAFTTNPEILRAIARGQGPSRYIFALGYAGWGPGQLESEIARGSWHDIASDRDLLFGEDDKGKWQRALERRQIEL